MTKKDEYIRFTERVYTPIFSKPWWLDAVCGVDNWDVWIYKKGDSCLAAMPYYKENRGNYKYITKAPLTQNNGILFNYPETSKIAKKHAFEEEVITEAVKFIDSLNLDVYEQQFHYSFKNWLPFYWNNFTEMARYTYVIEDTIDINKVWDNITSKYRAVIRKGERNAVTQEDMDEKIFYEEHKKIFLKQGLQCPFSFDLWKRLYNACKDNSAGKIFYMKTKAGDVASLLFLVWDEDSVYQLLGGNIPEFQRLDTYDALIWKGIQFAGEMGKKYDFEGSMIKRISKSFREFGGEPKPYFRVRKVYNPEICIKEAEEYSGRVLRR